MQGRFGKHMLVLGNSLWDERSKDKRREDNKEIFASGLHGEVAR
jgi:hypothetical protein